MRALTSHILHSGVIFFTSTIEILCRADTFVKRQTGKREGGEEDEVREKNEGKLNTVTNDGQIEEANSHALSIVTGETMSLDDDTSSRLPNNISGAY